MLSKYISKYKYYACLEEVYESSCLCIYRSTKLHATNPSVRTAINLNATWKKSKISDAGHGLFSCSASVAFSIFSCSIFGCLELCLGLDFPHYFPSNLDLSFNLYPQVDQFTTRSFHLHGRHNPRFKSRLSISLPDFLPKHMNAWPPPLFCLPSNFPASSNFPPLAVKGVYHRQNRHNQLLLRMLLHLYQY